MAAKDTAIKIPIGERCQVQIDQSKFSSVLRGYHFPKFVLMETPTAKGKIAVAPTGFYYIVRFIHEGHVCGFESQLLKQYGTPISLWVMKYPEDMQIVNLRKSKRISTFLPANLVLNGEAIPGAVIDISEGGGLFTTDIEKLEQNVTFGISFTLPTGEKVEQLPCVSRAIFKKDNRTMVGLSFDTEDERANPVKSFYLEMAGHLF